MPDLEQCGYCCAAFSAFGAVFLFVVNEVIKSGSTSIAIAEDKRDSAADSALQGALIYVGFIFVSIGCVLKKRATG